MLQKYPLFRTKKVIDLPFNKKRAIYRWVSYTHEILKWWRHEKKNASQHTNYRATPDPYDRRIRLNTSNSVHNHQRHQHSVFLTVKETATDINVAFVPIKLPMGNIATPYGVSGMSLRILRLFPSETLTFSVQPTQYFPQILK